MKRNVKIILLATVFLVGIFLRTYHHADWLHFESDQSRDAMVVESVLKDNAPLPLLGPQARGSGLLLGPVFYYFQIVAAYVGGISANVLAWPDLLFSIGFLIVIWFLLREFVDEKIALIMTGVAATSLFLVTYGRFAWNPNSLPFFSALAVYALLQMNKQHRPILWAIICGLALGIGSQLHFLFLLTIPFLISGAVWKTRPRIKWQTLLVVLGAFVLVYVPVFVSEMKTGAQNSAALFDTVSEKGSRDDKHNIAEKFFRMFQETSRAYWLALSADQHGDNVMTRNNKGSVSVLCDGNCRKNLPFTLLAIVVFIFSLAVLAKISTRQKEGARKNALSLLLFWLLGTMLIFVPVAYQISPRFFLILAAPFLILGALVLEWINTDVFKNKTFVPVACLGAILIAVNLAANWQYFAKQAMTGNENVKLERDTVLSQDALVTLQQLDAIAKHAEKIVEGKGKIILVGDNRYARSFWFLVKQESGTDHLWRKASEFNGDEDCEGVIILLKTDTVKNGGLSEKLGLFEKASEKKFGTLTVQYYRRKQGT